MMLPFGCPKRGALLLGYAVCALGLGLIYASICTEWKLGGNTKLHWYVCCNNCRNGIVEDADECNGYTYHGGSDKHYSGNCGEVADDENPWITSNTPSNGNVRNTCKAQVFRRATVAAISHQLHNFLNSQADKT